MTVICELRTFDNISDDWDDVLLNSSNNNIFLTSTWQENWWQSLGIQDHKLMLIKISLDSFVIGIAPLVKHDGIVTFLGGTDVADVHDFVVRRGFEEPFYEALTSYLDDQDWREIRLESLEANSDTISSLEYWGQNTGYTVDKILEDELVGVTLPSTWDDYLEGLRKKDRHELRRKFRKLEGEVDYHVEELQSVMEISDSIEDFLSLMAQSRDEKAAFLTDDRVAFFRSMALNMSIQGYLRLFFMVVNGTRTSAAVCFDYNNTLSLYNSGHDTSYSNLGTGFLLKATCLKTAIENGRNYYDMLRGSEPYKYHLGGVGRQLYRVSVYR